MHTWSRFGLHELIYITWFVIILDSRTAAWPLVKSPWNPILVVGCYLYLSMNVRALTQKIPAYQLKPFVIGYNAIMLGLSAYMAFEVSAELTREVCFLL